MNATPRHQLIKGKTYRACRAAGMPATEALERATYIAGIKAGLEEWELGESTHWELPNQEVWFKETPEGRYEVAYKIDLDADTDDESLAHYDLATQDAFHNQDWYFWQVSVAFIHKDGRVGEAFLGSIDAGETFNTPIYPLDEPHQVYAVAIDFYRLDKDAYAEALELPAPEQDEALEYDAMNALGLAGFRYYYHQDECSMVFGRGSGEAEQWMLGNPLPNNAGVNLSLHSSFHNETLTADHATPESFVAAFTATFERLDEEWKGE
jgi:hypothetical protein